MGVTAAEIRRRAEELREQITADRRYLHQIPEIGMELPKTADYIRKRLDEMGIPWENCGGDLPEQVTRDFMEAGFPRMERAEGVTAVIGHGSPCILLRADMDALPIREASDLEFRSGNGYGHKPGEETGAGARVLVENGLLENPKVDAAFGLHVQSVTRTGELGYAVGVNSASLDTFILKIRGSGGHSSQPQLCIDPLMIMNQVYQAVNLLVTREADPAAMVALTCGVAKGGTAVNIIPGEAELHIGVRTLDVQAADHLTRRIPEVIDHYVKAWRGAYDLTVFHTPCTYSDEALCRELVPFAEEILGKENVCQIPPMTGTEDFGYITREVPGMFAFIGAGQPGNAPLHNPHMVLDEEVLPLGAALHAYTAISWLASRR